MNWIPKPKPSSWEHFARFNVAPSWPHNSLVRQCRKCYTSGMTESAAEKPVKVTVFLSRALHRNLKIMAATHDIGLSRLIAGFAEAQLTKQKPRGRRPAK